MKIVRFYINETLVEKLCNDQTISHLLREDIQDHAVWNFTPDYGMQTEPLAGLGEIAVKIDTGLRELAGNGWKRLDLSNDYIITQTRAPMAYDGFGTICCVQFEDGSREVAILKEHYKWQTERYASGCYSCGYPITVP